MLRLSSSLVAGLTVLLGLGGCAAPRDAFERAERSLGRQDLPGALLAFDAVPISHARYPEARASALSVERRMRRGHELMLEGLLLRGEWRDQEALEVLERARAIWPRMPGVQVLIHATRNRARLMRERTTAATATESPILVPELLAGATPPPAPSVEIATAPRTGFDLPSLVPSSPIPLLPGPGPGPHPEDPAPAGPQAVAKKPARTAQVPVGDGGAAAKPGAAADTTPVARSGGSDGAGAARPGPPGPVRRAGADAGRSGTAVAGPSTVTRRVGEDEAERNGDGGSVPDSSTATKRVASQPAGKRATATAPGGSDPVAMGLVAVETRLGRGDLEAAVADLIELSQRFPTDARVRLRLARVLHQRALQRYGLGQLTSAIVDWERVIVLDPNNAVARKQLATARAEADPGSPRR
ncbi:MAG: hypothetical protein NXI31_26520 [bacterium]|nr:hypothetical protein [bacterium]